MATRKTYKPPTIKKVKLAVRGQALSTCKMESLKPLPMRVCEAGSWTCLRIDK